MTTTRTGALGPAAWPVAVPDDIDSPTVVKAAGRVQLPLRVRWSGRPKTYDLGHRADRIRVYEQVLREGTDVDVRYYVNIDDLLELWDELVLPSHVRRAWANWFRNHRALDLTC